MDIDHSVMENINAIWATPYGMAAKWVFIVGVVLTFLLIMFRHKMSFMEAALVLVGLKKMVQRDVWLILLQSVTIMAPIILLAISILVVNN